jgi:hypothetical protein
LLPVRSRLDPNLNEPVEKVAEPLEPVPTAYTVR